LNRKKTRAATKRQPKGQTGAALLCAKITFEDTTKWHFSRSSLYESI